MITFRSAYRTLSGLLFLCLLGCSQNPFLEDDEGGPRQQGTDNLSLPYALGTKVRIAVHSGSSAATKDWKLLSDSPAVLTVDKLGVDSTSQILVADCTAVGAGDAIVRAMDASGTERRRATVSVGVPDRVRVLAHAALRLVEQTPSAAPSTEVQEARVLTGSQGVFALIYQKGEQRLYGRGIIKFDPVAQLTVTNQTSSGSQVTEWLFVKPMGNGSYSLALRLGQSPLRTLPVVAVPDSAIGGFGLLPQVPESPKNEQNLWVAVKAHDAMARDIQGVYASWTLAGVAQVGGGGNQTIGDLYRYQYAQGAVQELAATHGALRATIPIMASKGIVSDTTYLGCSLSGSAPTGSPLMPLLGAAALGLLLYRSRRHKSALPA